MEIINLYFFQLLGMNTGEKKEKALNRLIFHVLKILIATVGFFMYSLNTENKSTKVKLKTT